MKHDITYYAKKRHTAKAYDTTKKISDENVEKIKELLRYSASSTNSQPWHFIIASTEAGKERIAKANESLYPFNNPSIRAASHVVIFCSRLSIEEDHLSKVLAQEEADGRFTHPPSKESMNGARTMFINLHKHDYKDVQHWMDKQVYLNVGQFLLGVATLGVDATPMEGIDVKSIDAEFGLREKGYTSLVAVTLGYHDVENDYNAKLPKSRLPYSEILTEL
jgi:nitroreductase/dihydropteridine reductase